MLFTDGWFLVLVLATMAAFYLPVLRPAQTPTLIVASLVFYSLNQVVYLPLLLFSIAVNAAVRQAIYFRRDLRSARRWAVAGVVLNLALLCFFKYGGLLGRALPDAVSGPGGPGQFLLMVALPVGISFFTFEGISLVVDSYKARDAADFFGTNAGRSRAAHLASTTLFISFFPHLVAGPILKAHDFYPQIAPKRLRDVHWEFCFCKLVVGYFLKMVVADNLKEYTLWMRFPYFQNMPGDELLAMVFAFSMQIFADFAGYSLIAVGVAGLFGYRLPENFEFPYVSQSFSEFWRRWHISLSSWLREYLYFPLGGNRRGNLRTYLNLFVVMFLGGLWHGAAWSYAAWGTVHGLALAAERFVAGRRAKREVAAGPAAPLSWPLRASVRLGKTLGVFFVVTVAWLLFKFPDFDHVLAYVRATGRNPWNQAFAPRVFAMLLLSAPVVVYHLAYAARARPDRRRLSPPFPDGPASWWAIWSHQARRAPLVLWGHVTRWPTNGWVRPVAYGVMLFLILVNAGNPGEFIYFQF
jgi:alginate O-acetyltransferase complex protein AlgI